MNDQNGHKSLAEALAAVQANLPKIAKSETAEVTTKSGSFSYSYANLADISEKIFDLLASNRLCFIAKPTLIGENGDRFVLAYSLIHGPSGEREDGEYPLPTGGTPQALGSAITYGRRYCLCAITGVAPVDDDDAAAAEAEAAGNKGSAQRAAKPRPSRRAEPEPPKAPTAQRKLAAAPPLPTDGDEPDMVTGAQLARLAMDFNEVGWTERDDKLRAAATIVGRPLSSSKQLTKKEASQVIDLLEQAKADEDPATKLTDLIDYIEAHRKMGAQ